MVFSAREPRGVDLAGRWSRGHGLSLRGKLEEAPLHGWVSERFVPPDFRGVARGEVELTLPTGGKPSGELRLEKLAFVLPPVEVGNEGDVRLSYRNGELSIGALSLKGEDFQLQAAGRIAPGSSWDLSVRGTSDLALARRITSKVREASGSASADVTVRGPWGRPAIQGPVEIQEGARLLVEGVDLPFKEIAGQGYLDGRRGLAVESVDARFGDEGRLHAEGFVGTRGFRWTDLRLFIEARDIVYERPRQVTYRFDADLMATGGPAKPELRGDVRLKNLAYAKRLNWKTMVLDFLRRRPREVERRAAEGGLLVDLAIAGSQDLKVENNLADLELAVDLRARGIFPEPHLWGRVEVLGGTIRFRSRDYDALRSTVEFLGETQPIPLLDLHARTSVGQYAVTVDVSGRLDRYQVSMASVPPLPQTELLALLTVGPAPPETISAANIVSGAPLRESVTAQAITTAEATSFLTGRIQDVLESEVTDILGFEQFHIDPAYSAATQTSVPKVTVGKTITRALFARYSASLGLQPEQDLELQYTLSPVVQVLGTWSDKSTQTKGSLGGEVRFRFTFR
ncbi:MAG: translocation/assembly module TamB domain-containing protein [Deltaproteobacteria bacterium]|nr:translocation/assembly module TamB domain-containing protein [Deltaproteobacteria bacterium]